MRAAIDETELGTHKDLQIELAPVRADLNLLKWMMGVLIAIAAANFAKQFFRPVSPSVSPVPCSNRTLGVGQAK